MHYAFIASIGFHTLATLIAFIAFIAVVVLVVFVHLIGGIASIAFDGVVGAATTLPEPNQAWSFLAKFSEGLELKEQMLAH